MKSQLALVLVLVMALAAGASAFGADAVSKEEYQKLQKEHEQLKKEMKELLEWKNQVQTKGAAAGTATALSGEEKAAPGGVSLGSTKLLVTGYGAAGFTERRHGDDGFTAQFNPIFLWKLSDRLFFEGEIELELEESATATKLELASLYYVATDHLTLGAGKFLNPMNSFVERFHMAWVNRLPDKPLAVYDGLLPETYVGAQARGGVPLGSTKLNYSLFIGNAPQLKRSGEDLSEAGTFEFDNFDNAGSHYAFGGRLGFLPIPELEFGYGIHYSRVDDGVDAWLQSVDVNYVRDSEALRGMVRVNAQWVWSQVGRVTYDEGDFGGTPGNTFTFSNRRNGGYAQIAYRPTKVASTIVQKLEPVFRYDLLEQKKTPVGYDESRYTIGLNYWLGPSTVLKTAYQFDDRSHGSQNQNAILIQAAMGF